MVSTPEAVATGRMIFTARPPICAPAIPVAPNKSPPMRRLARRIVVVRLAGDGLFRIMGSSLAPSLERHCPILGDIGRGHRSAAVAPRLPDVGDDGGNLCIAQGLRERRHSERPGVARRRPWVTA